MVALPAWVQDGRDRGDRGATARPGDPRPAECRMVLEADAVSRSTRIHDRHGRRIPIGDGPRGMTVVAAAEQAKVAPGDFVCEILSVSEMAVGIVGSAPGSRTEEDVRAILRHPGAHGGLRRHLPRRLPTPARLGRFARYLGHHTRELGDYTWAEAVTHLTTHAARRFRLTDRGLIRTGSSPISPSSTPSRSPTVRPTPKAGPWPRGRSRHRQRHSRPPGRRADRRNARPALRRG